MSAMTVRKLMKTPPLKVTPTTTLPAAQDVMTRAGVHHLPVVDRDGKLVGMLSAHDIEQALAILAVVEGKRLTLDVGDICTDDVPRVGPELPAHEVAAILIESRADGLPVVDTNGEVIGVVTATDFVEVAREALAGVDPQRRARA
jgi:CBS domain-containing membrane protein